MQLELPNAWEPRHYQLPLWGHLEAGGKRAVAVWHRRAGKDSLAINWTACAAVQEPGVYWHMLPTQRQGRVVVWDARDRAGRRLIDQAFPSAIRTRTNDQEMKIELLSGSLWQVVGSDNYDRLVGGNPRGVVFSEWSLTDPAAWDYIRPILAENGGWALFIYTPRGRNHGARLLEQAKAAGWFTQVLTVEDTGAIPLTAIDDERRAGMDEGTIRQEFWCSFDAAIKGSYYGELIAKAEDEKRVEKVPVESTIQVTTAWDLGIGDSTAIWFVQVIGLEVRVIDFYEHAGVGLDHYAHVLREKGYVYGEHLFPHDVEVRELGSGKTRIEQLRSLGIRARTIPQSRVEDGIAAGRALIPRCWFDAERCQRGLDALRQYRREWDEKRQTFNERPLHDWTSHAADAWRYLAQGLRVGGQGAWKQGTVIAPVEFAI